MNNREYLCRLFILDAFKKEDLYDVIIQRVPDSEYGFAPPEITDTACIIRIDLDKFLSRTKQLDEASLVRALVYWSTRIKLRLIAMAEICKSRSITADKISESEFELMDEKIRVTLGTIPGDRSE